MQFTDEQKNALMKYEEIKLQIKSLEAELDPLKEIIIPVMEDGKDLQGEKGIFKMKSRANWKFSPELTQEKKDLKKKEEDEIAKGIAENKPTVYLEYKATEGDESAE